MAEYTAVQDMDAFLIHPTMKRGGDDVDFEPFNMPEDLVPIYLAEEVRMARVGKKPVRPEGAIHKFDNTTVFLRGYASEEEAASPTEDDDFGFNSTSDTESVASIPKNISIEDLSEQANALQLCTKAQAVQYVSAGKAKVVSVPKVVDFTPVAESSKRSLVDTAASADSPRSQVYRYSSDASRDSNSAEDKLVQRKVLRRKANLTPLQPTTTARPPRAVRMQTPLADQRADFVRHDHSSQKSDDSPSSASLLKRRMPKLSPSFRFRGFNRPNRSNSTSSSGSSEASEGRMDWWSTAASPTSPATPATPNFSRPTRTPAPKMIARGANERAPPLVLPPCPDDYSEKPTGYQSQWPLRHDSFSNNEGPLEHIRRKNASAAFVTAQA